MGLMVTSTQLPTIDAALDKPSIDPEVVEQSASYHTLFRESLLAMARDIQQVVEETEHVPPPEVRTQATHLLGLLLRRDETWPAARDLLISLAPKMEQAGHRNDWIPYLEQGIQYSQQHQEIAAEAELTAQLGLLHQLLGRPQVAYDYFSQAEQLFRSVSDLQSRAQSLNRMAHVGYLLQRYDHAEELARAVLDFPSIKETEYASSFHILGKLAVTNGDWLHAEEFFQQALAIRQRNGDQRHVARRLSELGILYGRAKKYEKAIQKFDAAIRLFGIVEDHLQQAIVRMNLGVVFLLNDQPVKALMNFKRAEQPIVQAQDIWHLGKLYNNRGIAYRQLVNWEVAERAFHTSITYQQRCGNKEELVNALLELGILYKESQSWSKAREVLNKAYHHLPTLALTRRDYYRDKIGAVLVVLDSHLPSSTAGQSTSLLQMNEIIGGRQDPNSNYDGEESKSQNYGNNAIVYT